MTRPGDQQSLGLTSLVPVAAVSVAHLLAFGGLLHYLLSGDLEDALICAAPAVVAVALGFTSRADRQQYVARLFAVQLFGPIGLLMWASSHPGGGWVLLALVALQIVVFLAVLLWLASYATRISACPGAPPVGAERFMRRLASLHRSSAGLFRISSDGRPNVWSVDLRAASAQGRSHRLDLVLDTAAGCVRVKEFLAADGAAPASASEQDMRSLGEAYFDPARPDAQAVWSRTWQSSMLVPERLLQTVVEFSGDEVRFALPGQPAVDNESVVTLFAVVATRSGYAWAPRLFGSS